MERYQTRRWLVGTAVALALLVFVGPLLLGGGMMGGVGAMGGTAGGMWGPMHEGWMGSGAMGGVTGWWLLVAVLWRLLILAAVVGGAYLLYRAMVGEGSGPGDGADSAIEELRRAYARGELSDEEYEKRRERLENE
ncbi:MAG: SHOCT domain-containing protein [Haloquadratum sp.]